MPPNLSKYYWLALRHYQARTASFLALFLIIGLHMLDQSLPGVAYLLLISQFLIYPHLLYARTTRAKNQLQAEMTNLRLDALLVGMWTAALGFPTWIAFILFTGALLNNAINRGWRGVFGALLAYTLGVSIWATLYGLHLTPNTSLPVTAMCVCGFAIYNIAIGSIIFNQHRKLSETRATLRLEQQREQAIQQQLKASEERYRGLFSHMGNGFALHEIMCDAQGKPHDFRFLEVNPAYEKMLRQTREQLIGRRGSEVMPFANQEWLQQCAQIVATGIPQQGEYPIPAIERWFSTYTYRPAAGQFAIILQDITDRKQAEIALQQANDQLNARLGEITALQELLREQTLRDPLTGLHNRRYLDETLEHELARAKREGYPLCIALIDLDHFKRVNDTYGHQAGDEVLKNFGALLQKCTRSGDIACRYGGEEFLLLLPKIAPEVALQRAEELRGNFAQNSVEFGVFKITTTLSIGLAAYPLHGKTPDTLTHNADQALYRAKHAGRNRVVLFDETTPAQAEPGATESAHSC